MLDINYVRANLEAVREKLRARGFPLEMLDQFSALDERRRALIGQRDDLNAARNRESQEIGKLMKAGEKEEADSRRAAVREIGARIASAEAELSAIENDLNRLMMTVPNLPDDGVLQHDRLGVADRRRSLVRRPPSRSSTRSPGGPAV